ncbi:hypothetical protein [Pedobacter sp. SG918]|uniref:hypothetical protein n=1 Tax=Pedobacter sp. SG918 TaxID=2587136 RepID=UPI00146E1ADB|nr:hypothetical protein [Pedobacter sp. SG918]NMN37718.1 hypothetical protein [Pedobacter sp. SG918]
MIHPIKEYDYYINTTAQSFSDETKLSPIPTNAIINKVITGWGATWAEIKCKRHSIILLPHKSQIASKHIKHYTEDYTQDVTETIKIEKLKKYINARGSRYLKFLSTPEGLGKVIAALKECGIHPYQETFLLCDESHKITTDVKYRVNISSFADDFFLFTNKAMISATPFRPSHPKFDEQGFKMIKVNHARDIRKDITLLCVNNLGTAFKDYIGHYDGEMLFVFFNSLNGIETLISKNELKGKAHIYCSEDGVKDFSLKEGFKAFAKIDSTKLAKVNFLTSSFYNGLDIDGFAEMPDVLILTDLQYAEWSLVDPNTDVYQILGRFRQPFGSPEMRDRYRTATHIINNKNNAAVKLENNALSDIGYSYMGYKAIRDLQNTVINESAINLYEEAKQRLRPYSNLINTKGELDRFKLDNYLYECRLKQCYGHPIALPLAYEFSQLFNVLEEHKVYLPEDFVSMSKKMNRYSKENIMLCCKIILENRFQADEKLRLATMNEIETRFPLVVRAEKHLGMARIQELGYRKSAIEKALLAYDITSALNHHGLIDAIVRLFKVGASYSVADIKTRIQKVYDEFKIKKTAKATDIKTYFHVFPFTGHVALKKKEIKQLEEGSLTDAEVLVDNNGIKKKSVRMYKIMERKLNTMSLNSTREKPFVPPVD